ncbi:hypothetical protein JKP88DRAFT_179121 [Tribonema minus]|uniref:Uncharacterized protein n=1 Tax=Tribonema minus TaxID=303371 RepID=A0A836CIB6_9STRA|nr:hypothetical protein JKP88DRAFT_179121 [Tribonema minus]
MREAMGALARDLERFQGENRILKRAVNIQNTRCKDVEAQLGAAQEAAAAAAAYAKRVEQVNYALGVRVQQMEGMGGEGGGFMERQPPDVY